MSETAEEQEVGFEVKGEFYKWTASDQAKDLMLIDRFTQMPAHQFFAAIEDEYERGRGPILLALIACSIRAKHVDWSVERIARLVMDTPLSEVTFIGGDLEEGDAEVPPTEAANAATSEASSEKSNGSPGARSKKSSATPE